MPDRTPAPALARPLHGPDPARRGSLSKGCAIALGVVALIALLIGVTLIGGYNKLVSSQEGIEAKWSEVENQYKRRFEMIPNLVATVEGAAEFERGVLTDVVEARAKVGQARLPETLPTDEKQLAAYMRAQQGLSGALGRLFALSENYPQLRATESFRDLQSQIEGTENRIAVARRDYIDMVQTYNTTRRRFPSNLVAGFLGYEKAAQFTVDEAETAVPVVDFGSDDE